MQGVFSVLNKYYSGTTLIGRCDEVISIFTDEENEFEFTQFNEVRVYLN